MSENEGKRRSGVAEEIAKSAAEATLALNPIVGMAGRDVLKASATVLRAMTTQPDKVARQWLDFASEFTSILTNSSTTEPDPKDRRFADKAWQKIR